MCFQKDPALLGSGMNVFSSGALLLETENKKTAPGFFQVKDLDKAFLVKPQVGMPEESPGGEEIIPEILFFFFFGSAGSSLSVNLQRSATSWDRIKNKELVSVIKAD